MEHIQNIEFLILPDLARRIEKDKSGQKALSLLYNKIIHKTSGLVPKKLNGYENTYEVRCSIKLRMVYSRYVKDGVDKYIFWDLVNHDQIANRDIFAPVEADGVPIDRNIHEEIEPVNIKDERYHQHYKNLLKNGISNEIIHVCNLDVLRRMNSAEVERFPWYIHEEQKKILKNDLPLFLNGPPGTGKTTLGVYRLIQEAMNNSGGKVIYVTYTDRLVQFAMRIAKSIADDEILTRISFLTFHDLVVQVTKNKNDILKKEKFISKFPSFYAKNCGGVVLKADLDELWNTIRSIIKGAVRLTEREKQIHGKMKISPRLKVHDLKEINLNRRNICLSVDELDKIADIYDRFLAEECMIDDMDLARMAAEKLPSEGFIYDMLFCDEIQDFTELQQLVLQRLMKHKTDNNEYPFFLCGDEGQIIYPSGFSWDFYKGYIYNLRKTSIDVESLYKNYRSTDTVIKLSNAIMAERRSKCGAKSTDAPLEDLREGDGPYFIDKSIIINTSIKERINSDTMIIVRNEKEKIKLISHDIFPELSVFTVFECKGLEYQHVVLWNFLDILKDYSECENFALKGDYKATLDYNSFYVGITRSIDSVFIADTVSNKVFLDNVKDAPVVAEKNLDEFLVIQSITEGNWEKRGHDLMENRHYKRAAEAFLKAEKFELSEYCIALAYREDGFYDKALDHFIQAEQWDDAASVLHDDSERKKVLIGKMIEMELEENLKVIAEKYILQGDYDNLFRWIKLNLEMKHVFGYMKMIYQSGAEMLLTNISKIENKIDNLIMEN